MYSKESAAIVTKPEIPIARFLDCCGGRVYEIFKKFPQIREKESSLPCPICRTSFICFQLVCCFETLRPQRHKGSTVTSKSARTYVGHACTRNLRFSCHVAVSAAYIRTKTNCVCTYVRWNVFRFVGVCWRTTVKSGGNYVAIEKWKGSVCVTGELA